MPDTTTAKPDLDAWFSTARMSTYRRYPNAEELYIWNTRLSKAFLEDIQHIEVLLRNWVNSILSPNTVYGNRWFQNPHIAFTSKAQATINKAIRRAGGQSAHSGKILAELPLDFWRFLLTSRYQTTIWPKLQKQLPKGISRIDFEKQVSIFYTLRNRAAHHEPLIKNNRHEEETYLDNISTAITKTAAWIDPMLLPGSISTHG